MAVRRPLVADFGTKEDDREQDRLELNGLERDSIERDSVERDSLEASTFRLILIVSPDLVSLSRSV